MNAEQLRVNARLEEQHWWFVGRRRILRALVERLLPPAGDRLVIDVGCGTGGNIGSLADAYQTVGIDTSPDAVALARGRFPRTRFIQGAAPDDLGELAAEASLFLATDVLEHVRDDFRMLSSLVAAASPGAFFLLTVPADPALWSAHDESHLHFRRYDQTRFCALWEGLPATPLLVSHYNTFLHRPIQAVRWWNQLRGRASGEAGTDLWLPRTPVNSALTALYARESRRLLAALDHGGAGYRHGVSLLAVLRREPGEAPVREKPTNIAPDRFDPYAANTPAAA
jgi:trans-aconitate methyltransferase